MAGVMDAAVDRSEAGRVIEAGGVAGHVLHGPYEELSAGRYQVTFRMRRSRKAAPADNSLCAILDVALDCGRTIIAYDFVFPADLQPEFQAFAVPFTLERAATVEYRVYTNGDTAFEVAEERRIIRLPDDASTVIEPSSDLPRLLVRDRSEAKKLYESGVALLVEDGRVTGRRDGVSFHADCRDDVNFVDELFLKKAYNFLVDAETCVIDVGMNVGLASLLFAAKPGVREVHAFEPFPETFARAEANLALNPTLAERITAANHGLGDGDADATFLVSDTGGDSGGQATRSVEGGTPVHLKIRDAGEALRPLLAAAGRRGLRRVVKIDCEGAEFDIFTSLSRAGLWTEIEMLMVEWHRVFPGRTQEELIRPLLAAGFIVTDLTPPDGNGFFYAHRIPAPGPARRGWRRLFG